MSAAIKACQIKCDTRERREKYSNHLSNLFPELRLWELLLQPLTVLTINLCLTDYSINHRWPLRVCTSTHTEKKQMCMHASFLQIPAEEASRYCMCRNVREVSLIKKWQLLTDPLKAFRWKMNFISNQIPFFNQQVQCAWTVFTDTVEYNTFIQTALLKWKKYFNPINCSKNV